MTDTATEILARCPKCREAMELVVTSNHAVAAEMQKHTFLCTPCNQVKIYMLPSK